MIIVFTFFSIYGWGPFTNSNKKVDLEKYSLRVDMLEKVDKKYLHIDWANGGPENSFWKEDKICSKFVTKFAKVCE